MNCVPLILCCFLIFSAIVQAQNFTLRTLNPGVQSARDVVARDLDNDGDMDLAVGSWSPGGVTFLEHLPFDSVRATEILAVGGTGRQVTAGDFDNDGDQDIAYASYNEDRYYILVNTGNPVPALRFQVTTLTEGANGAFVVRAADVNGDSLTDLVCADLASQRVRIYEQIAGQLTETWISWVATPALDVDIVDMNGDGIKEILVAAGQSGEEGGVYRLSRNQNGSYSVTQEIGNHYIASVRAADMDSDGNMDILAAEFAGQQLLRFERNGNGWTQSQLPGSPVHPYDIIVEDLDEDNLLDVAVAAQGAGSLGGGVFWWRQNANGSFTQQSLSTEPEFYGLEAADYDLDGDVDLLAANNIGSEVVWFRNNMGVPSWILGTVTAESNNLPVAGARVVAEQSGAFAVSDAAGHYSLGVSSGTYTLRFEHPCWEESRIENVSVAFEDTAFADMQMRRAQLLLGVTSLNIFIPWGESSLHIIPVENLGDAELYVSAAAHMTTPDNLWLVLNNSDLSVLPGETLNLEVEITADTNNGLLPEYIGEIVLQTNSCPDTVISIAVAAIVLDAPERPDVLPLTTDMLAAYPNPFNAQLTVPLSLRLDDHVTLLAFDITGRFVESLFMGTLPAGSHEISWNASHHASGKYILSMRTESGVHSARTVTLIK